MNGHNNVDEDEGEGKSLEIDDERSEEHNGADKSNGTPTSGIVDDDDSFSDANSTSPNIEHHRKLNSDLKPSNDSQTEKKHHSSFENNHKNLRWSNINDETEIKTMESANNESIIDNSLNLTAGDITIDSVKEHFNNLSISKKVDLMLDTNDGEFKKLIILK